MPIFSKSLELASRSDLRVFVANRIWSDVEKLLIDLGALKHGDPRLRRKDEEAEESSKKIRQTRVDDDEDSDWD